MATKRPGFQSHNRRPDTGVEQREDSQDAVRNRRIAIAQVALLRLVAQRAAEELRRVPPKRSDGG